MKEGYVCTLKEKLENQLNAQLAYKNLNCQVTEVKDEYSDNEIMLQVIDVFLGITNFLVDKKYYSIKKNMVILLARASAIKSIILSIKNPPCGLIF